MADIIGTANNDRINGSGTFVWNGTAWVQTGTNGTTNLADSVSAGLGNDEVSGGAGNDTLTGGKGADLLNGGTGDDVISGEEGNDTLIGGDGNDTLDYAKSLLGVNVNLATNSASGGHATGDKISAFENVTGTAASDTLIGNGAANILIGGAGNDLISGGIGADTLTGGLGLDTLDYSASLGAVNVNIETNIALGGQAAGDKISGFENLTGSALGDVLEGNTLANRILGGAGNDTITGGGGADTLQGGDGIDTLSYAGAGGGVRVNLAKGTASGGKAAGDKISGFENIVGSDAGDTLTGNAVANRILGGDGNDVIAGGAGADILAGATGLDTLDYHGSTAAVRVSLGNNKASGGDATGDKISGFENLTGSRFNDTLTGNAKANKIIGGAGADLIIGAAGADVLQGGAGLDTLSYAGSKVGVSVNLGTRAVSGGQATGDKITGFENVVGGKGADTLIGAAGVNELTGGAGADRLEGGDGGDVLFGGLAKDTLKGGAGADKLDGAEGDDLLSGDGGADQLTGGTGADTFAYAAVADSKASASHAFDALAGDVISGFTSADEVAAGAAHDKIDLTKLAQAALSGLTWNESTALAYGVWQSGNAAQTFVNIDTTGDGLADVVIKIASAEQLQLGDFVGVKEADHTAPVVEGVAYGPNDGTLKAGDTVTLIVTFSETVLVTGAPALTLNSGGTATYASGSGTKSLTFSYIVGAGQNAADLAIAAISLTGATIKDAAGNSADLTAVVVNPTGTLIVDTTAPGAPSIDLAATSDLGLSDSDNITSAATPTLSGVAEANASVQVFDGATLLGTATANDSSVWSFTTSKLADGDHSLTAVAKDAAGNLSTSSDSLSVHIDTAPPATPEFGLAHSALGESASNPTVSIVSDARVALIGHADANVIVELQGTDIRALSDANGDFTLRDVPLAIGANTLTAIVTDVAGNTSSFTMDVQRAEPSAAEPDQVMVWNDVMLEAIRMDASTPVFASRAMAMESIAVLDVINAIDGAPTFLVNLAPPGNVSTAAAVASAAHQVLLHLYPGQAEALDAALATSLAGIPDSAAKTAGVAYGNSVADAVIAIRDQDGWDAFATHVDSDAPGHWQATGPMYDVPLAPQWGDVTPFAMLSGDQFRPDGPPDLNSAEYAAALAEVMSLGSANSTTRTADQTQIARFWADGSGTFTPGGHWNVIANDIAGSLDLGMASNARMFAMLNVALGDAGIAAWNTKYHYDFWRPETAIHLADADGNPLTTADPDWRPFLLSPPFPEYVSGHSTYSGAAAEILTSLFGEMSFTSDSAGLPGVTRSFDNFWDAADEAGFSRILGGIHFSFSNEDGKQLGSDIADWVINSFRTDQDTRAPIVITDAASGLVTADALTLTGFAVDNLSGLQSLTAQIDGGAAIAVTVDARGRFSLPAGLATDGSKDGAHTITFVATDASGNAANPLEFHFTLDTQSPVLAISSLVSGQVIDGDAHLAGVAGTGSAIVSLTYKLGDGSVVPISFTQGTGAFDTALDLKTLGAGTYNLVVTATDAAGHTTDQTISVTLAEDIPFKIVTVTPEDGAGDVGATFRPQIVFSRAVDVTTLDSNSFYATDSTGQKIAANVVVSQDHTNAWLFVQDAMPGGQTITLHVDGDAIKAESDGSALDGDGDGTAGGDLDSSFSTVSQTPVEGTSLSGFVVSPGADLKPMTFDDFRAGPDGTPYTADDVFLNKIVHAKVYVLGFEDQAVYTDENGAFTLTNIPAGTVKLAIDGRTATNAPDGLFFPEMVMDLTIRPGVDNTVMGSMGTAAEQTAHQDRGEVYLPAIQTSVLQDVSDTGQTTIIVGAEAAPNLTEEQRSQIELKVTGGSIVDDQGNVIDNAQVGISTVPAELVRDMLPPGLLQHTFDITIQAPGAAGFTAPAELILPNVFNAPPGTKLNLLSFDHTTGRLVIDGTATVSADGLYVTTDPGQGVTKPGWHGMTPPGTPTTPPTPPDKCDLGDALAKDAYSNVASLVSAGIDCIEEITGVKKYLGLVKEFGFGIKALVDDAKELAEEIKSGDTGGAVAAALQLVNDQKPRYVAAWELLQEQSPLGKIEKAISCASSLLGAAVDICERVAADPKCGGFKVDLACASLDILKRAIDGAKIIFDIVNDGIKDVGLEAFCFVADGLVKLANQYLDDPNKGFEHTVSLGELGANATTEELIQALFNQMNALADAANNVAENALSVKSLEDSIADIEPKTVDALDKSSESYAIINGVPGGMKFLIEIADQQIRGTADANGAIQAFLPADSAYRITVYDALEGRVAVQEGVSAPSGSNTELKLFLYREVGPTIDLDGDGVPDFTDTDHDGVVDIVEKVLGLSTTSTDSDNDGVSDFAELEAGTNPLDGQPVATGVIATADVGGTGQAIEIDGTTAIVAKGAEGIAILDISSTFSPVILSSLALSGVAQDVAVDAAQKIVVVALGAGGLAFVDYAQPGTPVVLRTVAGTVGQVEVIDGVAYATVDDKLVAYDIASGDALQAIQSGVIGAGALAHEGTTLYALDSNGLLHVFETSGGLLVAKGTVDVFISGAGVELFVGGGILYVPASNGFTGGYSTVDVHDPNAPVVISGADDTSLAGEAIALNGSGLGILVGNPGGVFGTNVIDIVRTDDAGNTGDFVTRINLGSHPISIAVANGLAYVTTEDGKVHVVNYLAFDTAGQAPVVTLMDGLTDVDTVTDGIQVQEGTVINFGASIADDVQVRSVELLVNGVAQTVDTAYPFDLRAYLPTLAQLGSDTVTLQVRAMDTGGNFGLSQEVTVQLVADIVAPEIIASSIHDGQVVGSSFRNVSFTFSERLLDTTVTADAFILTAPDGTTLAPQSVTLRDGGRTAVVSYDALTYGNYHLEVDGTKITDVAGNPVTAVGATNPSYDFTAQQFTTEWINLVGGDAAVAANWSGGVVPGAADEVLISAPGDVTVTLGYANATITSIVSDERLELNYAALTVSGAANIANLSIGSYSTASFGGPATLGSMTMNDGYGASLQTLGATSITGSLHVLGGRLLGDNHTVTVEAGGSFELGSAARGGYLRLQSDLVLAGNGLLRNGSDLLFGTNFPSVSPAALSILAGATLTIEDGMDASAYHAQSKKSTISNAGTIVKQGVDSAGFGYGLTFDNSGVLDIQSGNLFINNLTSTGSVNVAAGAALHVTGQSQFVAGSTLNFDGTLFVDGGTTNVASTLGLGDLVLQNGGNLVAQDGAALTNLSMKNGTLTSLGQTSISGTLYAQSGSLLGDDKKVTVAAGGALELGRASTISYGVTHTHGGYLHLESDLSLAGVGMLWDGSRLTMGNYGTYNPTTYTYDSLPATLSVLAGATLTIDNRFYASGVSNSSTTSKISNAGTIVKQGVDGASFGRGLSFDNTGELDVQSGDLAITNLNSTGTVDVAAGAALHVLGHSVFAAGSTLNLDGTLFVDGGTTEVVSTLGLGDLVLQGNGNLVALDGTTITNLAMANGALTSLGQSTISNTLSVYRGSLLGDNRTVTLASGGAFELGRASVVYNGYTYTQGGDLRLESDLVLAGTGLLRDGSSMVFGSRVYNPATYSYDDFAASLSILSGATLTIENGLSAAADWAGYHASTISNAGSLVKQGIAFASFDAGIRFENSGALNVQGGDLSLSDLHSTGTVTVAAGAALHVAGQSSFAVGSTLKLDGTLVVDNGTTQVATNQGLGNLVVQGGGSLVVANDAAISGVVANNGSITTLGTATIADVALSNGTLSTLGDTTISGALHVLYGRLLGDDHRVTVGGSLELGRVEASNGYTYGGALRLQSDLVLSGTGLLRDGSNMIFGSRVYNPSTYSYDDFAASLSILAGATLTIENSLSASADWAGVNASTISNAGSLVKQGVADAGFGAGIRFENTGTMSVEAGNLFLSDLHSTGTVDVAAGTALHVNGQTSFAVGSTLNVGGTLVVEGGTTEVATTQGLGALVVNGGGSLVVANDAVIAGVTVNNGNITTLGTATIAEVTLNSGSLSTLGDTTISGALHVLYGRLLGDDHRVTVGGSLELGRVEASNGYTYGGALRLQSDLVLSGTGLLRDGSNMIFGSRVYNPSTYSYDDFAASLSILAGATLTIENSLSASADWAGVNASTISNAGSLVKQGVADAGFGAGIRFENTGTMSVEAGNLFLSDLHSTGTVDVAAGTALHVNGQTSFAVGSTLNVGGTLVVEGGTTEVATTQGLGALVVNGGGSLVVANDAVIAGVTVNNGNITTLGTATIAEVTLNSGSLSTLGDTTISGALHVLYGRLLGDDHRVTVGGSLELGRVEASNGYTYGGALRLQSDLVLSGTGLLRDGSNMIFGSRVYNPSTYSYDDFAASLSILAGATLTIENSLSASADWAGVNASTISNAGSLVKQGVADAGFGAGIRFENTGTMSVEAGNLFLSDLHSTGTVDVAAGTALHVNGQTSFAVGSTLNVGGTLVVEGGTTEVATTQGLGALVVNGGGSLVVANDAVIAGVTVNNGNITTLGTATIAEVTLNSGSLSTLGDTTISGALHVLYGRLLGDDHRVTVGGSLELGRVEASNGYTYGGALRLQSDLVLSGTGLLRDGSNMIFGSRVYNPSTYSYDDFAASLSILAGATLTIENSLSASADWAGVNASTISNAGSLVKQGVADAGFGAGIRFENTGTMSVEAGNLFLSDLHSTGTVDVAAGTALHVNGQTSFAVGSTLNVGGTLVVEGGTTEVATTQGLGALVVNGGGSLVVANDAVIAGVTVNNGNITTLGTATIAEVTLNSGSLSALGHTTISGGLHVLNGLVLGDNHTVTVNGALELGRFDTGIGYSYGGTMRIGSDLVLAGTALLRDRSNLILGNDWVYNTATYTNDDFPASLSILAGATLTIEDRLYASANWAGQAASTISNAGTIIKEGLSGARFGDGLKFENSGALLLQGGDILVNDLTSTGTVEVAAGTALHVNGQTSFAVGSILNVGGALVVEGGTTTVAAATEIGIATLVINGGTLAVSGDLTVLSDFQQYSGGIQLLSASAIDLSAGSTGIIALTGSAGDDRITGTRFADSIYGGDGADTLIGGEGSGDLLDGGAGRDEIHVGLGVSLVYASGDLVTLQSEVQVFDFKSDFIVDTSQSFVTSDIFFADQYGLGSITLAAAHTISVVGDAYYLSGANFEIRLHGLQIGPDAGFVDADLDGFVDDFTLQKDNGDGTFTQLIQTDVLIF